MSSYPHRLSLFALSLLLCFGLFGVDDARAEADDEALLIPVDGFLTDADERPIDEQTQVTFALYATASADDPFWTETHQLEVDGGAFAAYLGSYEHLSVQYFLDHRAPYLTMQIEGDSEMDRWPVGSVPFAAVAHRADDAMTLQGLEPDDLGGAHSADGVEYDDSATGLGAESSQEAIEALVARIEQLEDQVADHGDEIDANSGDIADVVDQVSGFASDISDLETAVAINENNIEDLEDDVAANQTAIYDLEQQMSTATEDITGLQSTVDDHGDQLVSLDDAVSDVQQRIAPMTRMDVNGEDSMVFDDVNVHIRSGAGSTDAGVNGRGNLIVGYDEGEADDKTGSHNIVFGTNATYSSYGGLIGGDSNRTEAPYTSVISGQNNAATENQSVVVSGQNGQASGTASVVVSGSTGAASGYASAVVSGSGGEASGSRSVVTGGWQNTASGSWSVVSGGNNVEEDRLDYWRGGGLSSHSD